jgi:integrase
MLTLLLGQRAGEILNIRVRDIDDKGKLLVIEEAKTDAGIRTLQIPKQLQKLLKLHARGRDGEELLFGQHDRRFVNSWVRGICKLAGVPVVTAHGMRGLHASLGHEQGTMAHAVASSLGHESFKVSSEHYVSKQAQMNAKQKHVEELLKK